MIKEITIDITPVPKPRMTRADSWRKRPIVLTYWAYKDELVLKANLAKLTIGPEVDLVIHIPMPATWSKKKKELMDGKPHQSKGDGDNILKGIFDCLCKQDNFIWKVSYEKRWGYKGKIIFKNLGK